MAVPTVISPATPAVQAFMDRKQREWLRRDVRDAFERSARRGSRNMLVPLDAARRLLEMAGA